MMSVARALRTLNWQGHSSVSLNPGSGTAPPAEGGWLYQPGGLGGGAPQENF